MRQTLAHRFFFHPITWVGISAVVFYGFIRGGVPLLSMPTGILGTTNSAWLVGGLPAVVLGSLPSFFAALIVSMSLRFPLSGAVRLKNDRGRAWSLFVLMVVLELGQAGERLLGIFPVYGTFDVCDIAAIVVGWLIGSRVAPIRHFSNNAPRWRDVALCVGILLSTLATSSRGKHAPLVCDPIPEPEPIELVVESCDKATAPVQAPYLIIPFAKQIFFVGGGRVRVFDNSNRAVPRCVGSFSVPNNTDIVLIDHFLVGDGGRGAQDLLRIDVANFPKIVAINFPFGLNAYRSRSCTPGPAPREAAK